MKKPVDDSYHPPAPNFYANRGEVLATRANLPHWNKALTCCFATFRLADSLPREELLKRLERRGVDLGSEAVLNGEAASSPLVSEAQKCNPSLQEEIQNCLDNGYGSCLLKDAAICQIVEDALWHFAGERYHLYAYVVMPNHVHVLFQPMEGRILSRIVADWKSFTAHKINELRETDGTIWQKESFDTLIRSQRHFQTVISYIRKNDLTRAWVVYQ